MLAVTAVRSLGAKSADSQAAPVREWFTGASRAAARLRTPWHGRWWRPVRQPPESGRTLNWRVLLLSAGCGSAILGTPLMTEFNVGRAVRE